MSSCCDDSVIYVRLSGNRDVVVDSVPHSAGIIAVKSVGPWFYGHKIKRDENPEPPFTRHRLHIHKRDRRTA